MYNRYIPLDQGKYDPIPEDDSCHQQETSHGRDEKCSPPPLSSDRNGKRDGLTGFLRHLLDQFHLESLDTGDLLLLALLFLLLREDADDELLTALGLLLIL